jgi:hypothetical protein
MTSTGQTTPRNTSAGLRLVPSAGLPLVPSAELQVVNAFCRPYHRADHLVRFPTENVQPCVRQFSSSCQHG